MTNASAVLFDQPVFEVARLLGFLFNREAPSVMGKTRARGSRGETALTSLLLHFISKPEGEARSPIGFDIVQEQAMSELGRTDRGWITSGAKRIEEQLIYDEPGQAIAEIGAWIAEGLRLAGVIRRLMGDVEVPSDLPSNWRKSDVWQTILSLGRSSRRAERAPDFTAEDEIQIERFEAEREAARKARETAAQSAYAARHAASLAKGKELSFAASKALAEARQARAAKISVTISKSQAVLSAVTSDATLAKELCELRAYEEGASPSGRCGLVSCAPALRGPGLTLSLFVRANKKTLDNPKIGEALAAIMKRVGYRFSPQGLHPYGEGSHKGGGGIWRWEWLMLPADVRADLAVKPV